MMQVRNLAMLAERMGTTDLPSVSSRLDQDGSSSRRKQTLLSLLDALHELTRDEEIIGAPDVRNDQPIFEDDKDVPTVDEHLQQVGADAFNNFHRRIIHLDRELRNFGNAARQLGSSVGILSSSFQLRERLAQVLFLFRQNAADLFPRKVSRQPREMLMDPNMRNWRKTKEHKSPPSATNPKVIDKLEPEDFPYQLKMFARDVMTFLDCLNEFPEFADESLNASIRGLEGDLKYWASCLKAYEGQFKFPAVERYLHDISAEMGDHLDSITSSLSVFIEIGVPTIRFAQQHASHNLLNLSTVATFFSAVTATTMQFSYTMTSTPLEQAVNTFWFTSLVFSIAAAVNSLLGLTWKQAMYRSPGHTVPWWILIWIKRSPLIFLVLSVACFSVGLVVFAYASGQGKITSTLTTVFSAFSSFGLAAVSMWFASEKWIFIRHHGRKWLADSLTETKDKIYSIPGVRWLIHEPRAWAQAMRSWVSRQARITGDALLRLNARALVRCQSGSLDTVSETLEAGELRSPSIAPYTPNHSSGARTRTASSIGPLAALSEKSPATTTSLDGLETATVLDEDVTTPEQPVTAKSRFVNAVRSVMMLRSMASPFSIGVSSGSGHKRHASSADARAGVVGEAEPLGLLRSSRVAALVPKLKSLETTQDIAAHQALVRHLQFSPDGKFLATSSWDRTSVIFRVGDPFVSHRILAQPQGFVGQVAWSSNGNTLLTKLNRGVKVWTDDGVCRKTIDRKRTVQSIAWLPAGEAFMSVEGSDVTKLDLNGEVLEAYHFDRMTLHDVAVTQDCQRMLCVGTLMASSDGLHPCRSRAEKQIIVYNLDKKTIENRVPVLHDVRDITLSRDDVALVSYENKAPPQLWRLDLVKDIGRLSLRHTYMPKVSVDFAGPSYFGGKNDQLVLCAGKAGDIHIWDRESATVLHHVRAQALGSDLTCIAWNPAADPFMFATGSHDGAVRIWTVPPPGTPPSDDSSQIRFAITSQAATVMAASTYGVDHMVESPSIQQGFDFRPQPLYRLEERYEEASTPLTPS